MTNVYSVIPELSNVAIQTISRYFSASEFAFHMPLTMFHVLF